MSYELPGYIIVKTVQMVQRIVMPLFMWILPLVLLIKYLYQIIRILLIKEILMVPPSLNGQS